MKRLITLAFSMIFALTAFGQRLEYEKSSNWFFGLNAGATWNTTDVQNKTYAGWGFLLGRSFNYDYGRRISYDLRLRYLRGKWYGQDTDSTNLNHLGDSYSGALAPYKDGLGYTVNNYEANVHELGLELAIHFNRFRDRTGWDPYIFGGANISWNETYGDLVNQDFFLAGDTTYAYDQIDMTEPAIEFALDENYETALDGTQPNKFNVNFMPSLGFGIGYDFGPRFQFGVEHKTTFALKDDFDGYADAEPNWGFLENDVYHYTSAFLRWRFRGGEGHTRPVKPQPTNPTTSGIANAPCQRPDVRVTRPLQRTETVEAINYVYRAEVRYVQSRHDIVMRVNGIETTNFLYNPQTHQLESYLYLQPGNNTIEVTGRNTCGTDRETSTIIYNDCIDPVVYFENVCSSTFTAQVDQRSYSVQAQISNATSVEFTVNGVRSTNFTFNNVTGRFRSNILLNEGQNTIRITAINGCATDTGTSVVTYTNCPDPIVNFVNGNSGFVSVSQANFDLNTYIYNVTSQNNISVRLNGSNRNFNFNGSTKLLTAALLLSPGQNKIVITATTNCGSDTETLTVDYTPCVNPWIQMVQPISQSTTTTNGTQAIQVSVFNVANVNQIQLFVNGNLQPGGSYNPVANMFEANVALNPGINTIQITVLNDCGTAAETVSVNYNPCVAPDVQMILPAANSGLTSSPSQLVQAMVFNVNNISEIQTYVNGTLQNGGTLNSANGLYQNTVALTLGINTIQVVATNSCGSDVQTVTITYRACEAPQITMTSPTTNPFFTNEANVDVTAMIGSVSNTSQVQVTVNGVVDASGATYNSASITYNNNVNLNAGNNVIVITATNSCGTVTEQINVIREVVVIDTPTEAVDSITICFVHSNNVGEPVTMSIPLSQWPAYQSQGAQLGPCPIVNKPVDLPMTICYTAGNNPPMTMQILTSEWPAYEALGATQGPCPEPMMTICFNGNELSIPASQWSTYQVQGATEGPCPIEQEETIIICHKPPGNPTNTQQLEIPLSAWPAHQAHGDVLGPCPTPDPEMVICLNGTEQTILTSEWATYEAQGATQGPCPVEDQMITICHHPPGNPTNTQELQIPLSAWPAHQAHGDVLGPCPAPDPEMTICLNGTEQTILTSEWASYQAQGATEGPCQVEDPMITICHHPPGNPSNTQELQIPLSAWPAHQAHGDVLGPCPTVDPEMVICLNGAEQIILTSEWATYQAQGATEGPCQVEDPMITICHHPPGNPTNTQELQIPLSAWPAHQAHGDVLGPCNGNGNNGNNGNSGCMPQVSGTFSSDDLNATANSTKDLSNVVLSFFDGTTQKFEGLSGYSATFSGTGQHQGKCIVGMWIKSGCNSSGEGPGYGEYVANTGYSGQCTNTVEPEEKMVICASTGTMTINVSEWATYQAQGATLGPCPAVDPEMTICLNGVEQTILTSEWSKYQSQGATQGPCPSLPNPQITICMSVNGVPTTMTILTSEWPSYQAQGATQGPCPAADPQMTICLNGNTKTILTSEWAKYQSKGATIGPCASAKMTICYNGRTIEIDTDDWSRYQTLGASAGACLDTPIDTEVGIGNQGIGNSDTLNGNIERPTNGGGNEDELLFGNRTITICHTPNGSIASQTMQIPLSEWEQYQALGATLGACTGSLNPTGGGGKVDVNNSGNSNGDGVGNVPINPNSGTGTEPTGGNMPVVGNGSQEAQQELIRKQKEEAERIKAAEAEAARKAEEARKKAAAQKAARDAEARRKAEEAKRKAAQEAETRRQAEEAKRKAAAEQAARDAEARRKAEEAKRKAAQEAETRHQAEEARRKAAAEKAAREAAARKKAEEAKRRAAQEAEARRKAEEARRKAAAEKAAREAEARRKAEEAKRKAAQEAEARRKAEEAAKKAAKKAAEEAARKKAEEQRKAKEREGGR